MLVEPSTRPHREAHAAALDNARTSFPQHTPAQNHILAALPPDALLHLLPELEIIPLPLGWVIHGAGQMQKYLFFPPRASLPGSTRRRPEIPQHSHSREMKARSASHPFWEAKAHRARRS